MTFEIHLTVEDLRTWISIHANSFLGIKYHETKMGDGAWEVIVGQKSEYCTKTSHSLLHSYFSVKQT